MKLGEALRSHYDILPTLPERLYKLVHQLERKGQNPRTDAPRLPQYDSLPGSTRGRGDTGFVIPVQLSNSRSHLAGLAPRTHGRA
jgi:hypothetical protein